MTFCFHKWSEVGKSFTPPRKDCDWEGWYSARLITCGMTVVYLKCQKCGDMKSREFFGQY